MRNGNIIAALASSVSSQNLMQWVLHLGGLGLIPLGILDSSVIPIPGSMDVATIILAARDKQLWFYYAFMATTGSVIGGFLTYRLASKGGKEALAKRFPRRNVEKVYKQFERWGFAAIAVPALLPPPIPIVPFLIAAGGAQYSKTKFLAALTLGRSIRYTVFAYLGARYGGQILSVLSRHVMAVTFTVITLAVLISLVFLIARRSKAYHAALGH
jgi:membrane protein YqaA with SNARE-associated domain